MTNYDSLSMYLYLFVSQEYSVAVSDNFVSTE